MSNLLIYFACVFFFCRKIILFNLLFFLLIIRTACVNFLNSGFDPPTENCCNLHLLLSTLGCVFFVCIYFIYFYIPNLHPNSKLCKRTIRTCHVCEFILYFKVCFVFLFTLLITLQLNQFNFLTPFFHLVNIS